MTKSSVISVIPARSGSISISKKNLQKIEGKSLLEYAIEASLKCDLISDTYVSSNSQEFLDQAILSGSNVHLRSEKNASNNASMLETIKEFDEFYNVNREKNLYYLILYPTYPFRTHVDLENIIAKYQEKSAKFIDGLIGVKEVSDHPYLAVDIKSEKITPIYNPDINKYFRRQDYPKQYLICHWACLICASSLDRLNSQLFSNNTFPYLIENSPVDIDTYHDLDLARLMSKLGRRKV